MSYIALYRKFRPKTFSEVEGQEHITTTLQNQIISDSVAHAYLFCGTRGTGKTSTALIFAKTLNCQTPVVTETTYEPCNTCESCVESNKNANLNIVEIDAASNNGVDNIREIKENVRYQVTNANYKIYIIDEVHMLSIGAFNALLKTLEEPPERTMFILATTDPHKIPQTILSRCQRYDFKRITADTIAQTISEYLKAENVDMTDEAMGYISILADGAMRDALTITDQAISYFPNQTITIEKVQEVLGTVDKSVYFEFCEQLMERNIKSVLDIIARVVEEGKNVSQFVADIIDFLRSILVAKMADGNVTQNMINASKDAIEQYTAIGRISDKDRLIYIIERFSELLADLKVQANQRTLLEVLCVKLCTPSLNDDLEDLVVRIQELEEKVRSLSEGGVYVQPAPVKEVEEAPKRKENLEVAIPDDIGDAITSWREITGRIRETWHQALFKLTYGGYVEGDDALYIVTANKSANSFLSKKEAQIHSILEFKYNKTFKLKYITEAEFNAKNGVTKDQFLEEQSKVEEIINFEIDFLD